MPSLTVYFKDEILRTDVDCVSTKFLKIFICDEKVIKNTDIYYFQIIVSVLKNTNSFLMFLFFSLHF